MTTVELADRLADVRKDVRVLGLEIDPDRVAAAAASADPPRLEFARGGFELAGRRPVLVRALNVLRQYDEAGRGRRLDRDVRPARPRRPAGRGHLRRARPPGLLGRAGRRAAR